MNEITKKGRGRPRGATSTVEMKLSDIIDYVDGDMDATQYQVGRGLESKDSCLDAFRACQGPRKSPSSNDNQI